MLLALALVPDRFDCGDFKKVPVVRRKHPPVHQGCELILLADPKGNTPPSGMDDPLLEAHIERDDWLTCPPAEQIPHVFGIEPASVL